MLAPATNSKDALPWQVLSQALGFPNRDQELWWINTAETLNRILVQCDYDVHLQYKYLAFYHKYIVPSLGPFRRQGLEPEFISGLSHGGHPLEISVKIDKSKTICRLGLQAIGPLAGTSYDPLNSFGDRELLANLATLLPHVDLRLFDHFNAQTGLDRKQCMVATTKLIKQSQSIICTSLDLKDGDVIPKVYFSTIPKGLVTETPLFDLTFQAIEQMEVYHKDAPLRSALATLKDFLRPRVPTDASITPPLTGLIGVDCIDPMLSRLKVYLATFRMDLALIREYWTLGGSLTDLSTMKGLEMVETLAKTLRLGDEACETIDADRLPFGINYAMKPGTSELSPPQIYFPLLGVNDEFIADALVEFFQYLGWDEQASRYKDELKAKFPHQDISQTTNIHRWLGVAYSETKGPSMNIYYDVVAGNLIGSL
ncbi:aromatic prenyltransferase [Aspergillus ambiguus]|uniref:aromatic prenyltransferase n=1 Tax=Aspergillus ambiguus TaxID=176160 RepID=UPI003CCD1B54